MYSLFNPQECVDSLFDINLEDLRDRGIKGVIFDLDNTIIAWDSIDMCPAIHKWLQHVIAANFSVVIVSNNWHKRVKLIADQFHVPFVSRAYKSIKTGFHEALRKLDLTAEEVAVVGDQLFTDVLGGNRMGMYTIWVQPLTEHEFIGTRIHRKLERVIVKKLRTRGLMK